MNELSALFGSNVKPSFGKNPDKHKKRKLPSATSSPKVQLKKPAVVEPTAEMKSNSQQKLQFKSKPTSVASAASTAATVDNPATQLAALQAQNAALIEAIKVSHTQTMQLMETDNKNAQRERKAYMQHTKELISAMREQDTVTMGQFENKLIAMNEKMQKMWQLALKPASSEETSTMKYIESKSPPISPSPAAATTKAKDVVSDGDEMFED